MWKHGLRGGGDDRENESNRGIRVSHVEHLAKGCPMLCNCTATPGHRDYTAYIWSCVVLHYRSQHDREHNKPNSTWMTALTTLMFWQLTWGQAVLGSEPGGLRSRQNQSQRKQQNQFIMSTPIQNTTSTRIQNITRATTTTTWRRSSWMNSVICQVSYFYNLQEQCMLINEFTYWNKLYHRLLFARAWTVIAVLVLFLGPE